MLPKRALQRLAARPTRAALALQFSTSARSKAEITLEVDGKSVSIEQGSSLIQVSAASAGLGGRLRRGPGLRKGRRHHPPVLVRSSLVFCWKLMRVLQLPR
jgi:hypothetical protein